MFGKESIRNVEGEQWIPSRVVQLDYLPKDNQSLAAVREALKGVIDPNGSFDGVWVTRRGKQAFALNKTDAPVIRRIVLNGQTRDVRIEPWTIVEVK